MKALPVTESDFFKWVNGPIMGAFKKVIFLLLNNYQSAAQGSFNQLAIVMKTKHSFPEHNLTQCTLPISTKELKKQSKPRLSSLQLNIGMCWDKGL